MIPPSSLELETHCNAVVDLGIDVYSLRVKFGQRLSRLEKAADLVATPSAKFVF